MKVLVFLFVSCLAVYNVSALISFAHKSPPHPDCKEHVKYITEEQVTELNKGRGDADNSIMKAHLLCVWKEKGVMSEDGVLNAEVIRRTIVPVLSPKSANCIVQKSSPLETASQFYKCIAPMLARSNH